MKVFLTGATGYIGSVVAEKLLAKGHQILGLARNEAAETKLREKGIEPWRGDLKDVESLKRGASVADAVIHTAFVFDFSDLDGSFKTEREAIAAFGDALAKTNKPFIATSGVLLLGDTKEVEADEDYPYDQNSPFFPRAESDEDALKMSREGVRSIVLRFPMVYGRGGSSGVKILLEQAKAAGAANYVGSGANRVSAIHVENAADLYILALEISAAIGLYHASAETISLKEVSEAIARLLDVEAKSVSIEEAQKQYGAMSAFFTINSRLSAEKARRELGWKPKAKTTITDDIENGSYRIFKEQKTAAVTKEK